MRALAQYPLVSPIISTIKRHERPLSAVAMIAGFAFDNYFFERVDHPATQIVLFAYLMAAIGTILLIHFIEARAQPSSAIQRMHPFVVAATQFALGGLWSAFLIFYGRSALAANAWPFVLVLAAMLIGNEAFRQYHARLALTLTLLFLALFSYTIMVVPVFTGSIGRSIFLLSGALAVIAFAFVLNALVVIDRKRIRQARRGIALGTASVLATVNIFYFANILPPLPLAIAHAGVFHSVAKDGDVYRAVAEPLQGFGLHGLLGAAPVMHVEKAGSLSVYGAVFAPIQLKTDVVHVWKRYDETSGTWRAESTVRFAIVGGRDGGYRGYSVKAAPANGRWRVDIETPEGLLIGRVKFTVAPGSAAGRTMQILR